MSWGHSNLMGGGGRSAIDKETKRGSTVNFSLSCKKVITPIDPGVDLQLSKRGSTLNFHFCVKRWLPLLILGGGVDLQLTKRGSTVNFHFHVKRQLPLLILHVGQICNKQREDQQSTFTFASKGDHLCWSGGSAIDKERINSQLSLLHEKAIASIDPGVGGGKSAIDKERINSQLSLLCEKAITSVDLGGGSTVKFHYFPWTIQKI